MRRNARDSCGAGPKTPLSPQPETFLQPDTDSEKSVPKCIYQVKPLY